MVSGTSKKVPTEKSPRKRGNFRGFNPTPQYAVTVEVTAVYGELII